MDSRSSDSPRRPAGVLDALGLADGAPLSQTPRRNVIRWVLLGLCLATVAAIIAGRSPQHFAMPILFSLGFGGLLGLAMGEMSRVLSVRRGLLATCYCGLLAAGGLAAITVQWYARYHEKTAQWFREHPLVHDPLSRELDELLKRPPSADESAENRQARIDMLASHQRSEDHRRAEERRRQEAVTFGGYLRERLTNLGPLKDLPSPWPALIWSAEVVAAALIAAALQAAARSRQSPAAGGPSTSSEDTPP